MSSSFPLADRQDAGRAELSRIDAHRRHHEEPPDPAPLVHNLVRCIFEIIVGARDIEQVARWVDPDVLSKMQRRLTLERRARGATGRAPIPPRVQFGASLIERPAEDVVECVTVVHAPARARALAMRLVLIEGRWRVTKIALL